MTNLTCQQCAATFTKTAKKGPAPRYCSSQCLLAARGRKPVQKHGSNGYSHGCRCEVCTTGNRDRLRAYFQRVGGNRNKKPHHRHKTKQAWTDTRREAAQLRRAQKLGTQTEPIDNRKVYERDQWKCGVCRKRVKSTLTYPHPLSASLDHIVPLSLHGTHTYDNVRLAHLRCNVERGNRGGNEQLLLIG